MFIRKKGIYIVLFLAVCLLNGCRTVDEKSDITGAEQQEDHTERDERIVKEAISCIEDKKYPQAIGLLSGIQDNEQAEDLLKQLRYLISGSYLANLEDGVAVLDKSGKVKIKTDHTYRKDNTYQESLDWEHIVSLSFAQDRLDALDKKGHIHSTKDTDPAYIYVAEKLKSYTDISAISTDFDSYVLLPRTGQIKVYTEKYSESLEYYKKEISTWTDVAKVINGKTRIAALKRDGTVYVADYNKYIYDANDTLYDEVASWTDIVDIADDIGGPMVGLKSDGTVVCSKYEIKAPNGELVDNPNAFDVSGWKDIIAISQSGYSLLGLKRDGSVVATGNNENKQLDVSDWHDIVAIAAGDWISIGLKSDGTIVMAGDCGTIDLPDISDMKNLYVPTVKY